MDSTPNSQSLLSDNRALWQTVSGYLAENNVDESDCARIERLAVASPYALQQLQRSPGLIDTLLALGSFRLDDEIVQIPQEKIDLDQLRRDLRLYRHRKLVEIIYLDVVRGVPLEDSLRHLSDLAEQEIRTALFLCNRQLAAKHGQPTHEDGRPMQLNIIAMGKLGGRELNFSSDIDLICCFAGDGKLGGYGQLTHQEYFNRLVRLLAQTLSDTTEDGFVYRVDLRLRPWGESGPAVLSHAAFEHYYQLHGREWEQYAMVKARVLSGSGEERDHLRSIIQPFVYRKYHDYRVFEGLAALKDKIDSQAKARAMRINIKVGQGGIREIEFFVQAFQILKGGRNYPLQTTSIFAAFDALENAKIVDAGTLKDLRAAYVFLRRLENRMQMFDDRQTHDLPDDPTARTRIAATLDYPDWESLEAELQQHRDCVHHCFNDLFQREAPLREVVIDDSFADGAEDSRQWEFIQSAGLDDAAAINQQLSEFLQSKAWGFMSARAKQRFNTLLPRLLETIRSSGNQATLFRRCMRLFASIAGRSVYFELLFQNPALLDKLGSLFERSAWIAEEVAQYPMLLENLIQASEHDSFDKSELLARLQHQLHSVAGDTELELDSLRLFKREQTLVIANAELTGAIGAADVGRYLSDLAEVVLESVYRLACTVLEQQFGVPECTDAGIRRKAEFAIIGYGKLGGRELHYQSDLDLIFLHDSSGEQQVTNGGEPIENSLYFARLAQKIISMTSVLTASGKLYEIDSRLRPEGSSGLLVSSARAYLRYQLDKAWTWEHQALVRARWAAGSPALEPGFKATREQVLKLRRDPAELRQAVIDMRARIYRNKRPPEGERRDLKHSRGGMVDIEFLVQYWVLAQANSIGSDCLSSDNISLINELFRLGLITRSQSKLVEIYQAYHRLLHESVLQNESAEVDAELIADEVRQVTNCWNECFGLEY